MTTITEIPKAWRLLNACSLRPETITNDNYAADLHSSLDKELARPESARQFFQSTYPTEGLKDVCRMIFNRLANGNQSNDPSLYRLDSGFGGGKTHTLITLAGAAKHPDLVRDGATPVPAAYATSQGVRIVPFTGENTDLVRGAEISGYSVRPKSLIGHIAVHLGGEYAYRQFREHDESLTAPGSEEIARLFGETPCLILIDELIQLLRRYEAHSRMDYIRQMTALCSAIAKAVEISPKTVMVVTTPDPAGDAYRSASQQVHDILDELNSVLSRTVHQAMPTSPDGRDLPHILRRRLFTHIDETAQKGVSKLYAGLMQRSAALIMPLPNDILAEDWFRKHYPFHPDALDIITERIAANDNFQKTRGTLRLLARTVQHMKKSGEDDALLLHLHHITPDSPEINSEITSKIDKTDFQSAIKADILDSDSTANRLDETRPSRPTRRIARATLLASLAPIASAQGLTASQLVRAVVTPADSDPSVVRNAITEFRNQALYVDDNPGSLQIRFTTVPNLNRILLERRNSISPAEINAQIKSAIGETFSMKTRNSRDLMNATIFPSEANIPDSSDSVHLGVLNYEWLCEGDEGLSAALTRFYRNSPLNNGQSPRQFKNNIAILVADRNSEDDMRHHARRHLAAQYITANPPATLMAHQKENLASELSQSRKDLFTAIQKVYVNLYYPSTDQPISSDTLLTRIRISPDAASESPGDGQSAVIDTLRNRRKLIMLDNADLDAEMYWNKRHNLLGGKVSLSNVKEEFAREPGNYMLMNGEVAMTLFRNALNREALVVETGSGQIIRTGDSLVHADDPEIMVYLSGQACPDCYHHTSECRCGKQEPQTCGLCGGTQHPGPCGIPEPDPKPLSFGVQGFSSGLEPKPLNVLAKDLRLHMDEHDVTSSDINKITLGGDKADFINFITSLIGQNAEGTVSYHLARGTEFELKVSGMRTSEWTGQMSRIGPMLERINGSELLDASVELHGGELSSEQMDRILDQLPASRTASMVVSFKQK